MITPNDNQRSQRPVGRPLGPTKLTPELTTKLCMLLALGAYIEQAAHLCDIAPSTVFAWMAAGRDGTKSPYAEFFGGVKKALALCELRYLMKLQKCKGRNWTRFA